MATAAAATTTTTTPQLQLQNIYHLRTVADPSAKSCLVCFKPSTAVLITPDNKDFFYICRGHLKDRAFASPIVDEVEAAAKKRQAELEREIERVKVEYAEKVKMKNEKKKGKDEEKGGDEKNEKEKEKEDEIKTATSATSATSAATSASASATGSESATSATGDEQLLLLPRIYALHRNFFHMRLDRIRKAELAKRNRERLSNPTTFPSVPSGNP
ncbi:MAG: hypothetical protein GOMPHAMPRED_006338 [Gomphillus americanus]|uniref:DUF1742-domain-containing protein n=1 Tax=Gomphillus americanus TaxID=1940652 RepID=A0A8H3ETZ3_9LECA|nr:MAG: hypothetical protein GOMPHAMPRED_006338 [Gomphillus americanus]